jgi:hypothetical protein
MSHSLSSLLLLYAQQFEDQHAPQNMTIALREAGDEITRLNAENERLRAALKDIARRSQPGTYASNTACAALG